MTDRDVLWKRAKPSSVTARDWWAVFWNAVSLTVLLEGVALIAWRVWR